MAATPAWNQLSGMLEEISVEARSRRQEYGRHGEVGGWGEVAESESGREVSWYEGM